MINSEEYLETTDIILREDMTRYEELTGRSADDKNIPIIEIHAFLEGIDKGIEEFKKMKEEISMTNGCGDFISTYDVQKLISKHIAELKGDQKIEESENHNLKEAANKIWDICKESPAMGNAVMDLIGEDAYQRVMIMINES